MGYVFGPMEEDIAPIRIPVSAETPETIVTADGFAHHVIRTVSNYARDASLMSEDDRRRMVEGANANEQLGGDAKSARLALTPGWLAGNVDLSAELSSATSAVATARSGSEIIQQASRVVDVVAAANLMPILVIDDSDSWFNVAGAEDRSHLVKGFFGPVVRMLAEELNGAVVVAVHETYLAMSAFQQAEGFIETTVRIPPLPNEEALRMILAKRVALHSEAVLEAVISDEAVARVYAHHTGAAAGNLRKTLLACHTALQAAFGDGATTISAGHVDTALADLSP